MNRREALALRAFALWTVFVWVVGIRNFVIGGDHSVGFRIVHGSLAAASIALALICWVVVSRVRGRT